jgi:hypothetical protein
VNPIEVSELLDRAADSVTPAETDPASKMVSLGRRSVRRRRAWGVAGAVAAAVVAAVAVPLALVAPHGSDSAGTTVSFAGLTVAVPKGWHVSRLTVLQPCSARPHTVYLAERFDFAYDGPQPSSAPPGTKFKCNNGNQAWIGIAEQGGGPLINPDQVLVKQGQLIQMEQFDTHLFPFLWSYRVSNDVIEVPRVFVSGDVKGRDQLLDRVSWPAGPPAPASGGLALPAHITSATSAAPPSNGMVVATDAKTLNRIRTELAQLRDSVPAGAECTLQRPGSVGISLGEVTVIVGDATCPQAISTGGGRVRVPPGLGQELLGLIVASDRAASEHSKKK